MATQWKHGGSGQRGAVPRQRRQPWWLHCTCTISQPCRKRLVGECKQHPCLLAATCSAVHNAGSVRPAAAAATAAAAPTAVAWVSLQGARRRRGWAAPGHVLRKLPRRVLNNSRFQTSKKRQEVTVPGSGRRATSNGRRDRGAPHRCPCKHYHILPRSCHAAPAARSAGG